MRQAIPFPMQTDEFASEEPTATYTPEMWSAEECEWMLLIAARTDAKRASEAA